MVGSSFFGLYKEVEGIREERVISAFWFYLGCLKSTERNRIVEFGNLHLHLMYNLPCILIQLKNVIKSTKKICVLMEKYAFIKRSFYTCYLFSSRLTKRKKNCHENLIKMNTYIHLYSI